jgi:large repetitive protein
MALVQVVDIASGEVVAEYQVPPTEQISLEPGQELVFADVEYGPLDATEPAVTFQEITDEDDEAADIQITLADGTVLVVENLALLLEDGEDTGIRFADAAEFATLQDFVFTAGGGTAGGPGGGLALGGGRGNDGSINPLDLNVPHIRALGVEGNIPRPAFEDETEIQPDNLEEGVGEDPIVVSITDAVPVNEPTLSSDEEPSEGPQEPVGTAGGLFVTGHDSDEHANGPLMTAGLDYLFFDSASTEDARGGITVAVLDDSGGSSAVSALNALGWSATLFDTDADFSQAFTFDAIVVASGNSTNLHNALMANEQNFADFINGGGKLYINTDENFGQTWFDFVPDFGDAVNNTISVSGAFSPTTEGLSIGLTDPIVDLNPTHSYFTGVDESIFTVFEVTDPEYFEDTIPVSFGSNNLTIGDGGFQTGSTFVVAEFTVFLEGGVAPADVTVTLSAVDGPEAGGTADNTATGGLDYNSLQFYADPDATVALANNQVTILAGDTSVKVYVKILPDQLAEFDEHFQLVLSDPIGAEIGDGTGQGTILDTTVPPTPEDDPANPDNEVNTVWEGADDTGNAANFVQSQTSGNIMDNDDTGTAPLAALPVVNVTLLTSYASTSSIVNGVQTISSDDGAWSVEIDLANGDYTFTLNGPVDQASLGDGNIAGLEFQYQLETASGVVSTPAVLGIAIVDDVPMAYNDLDVLPEGEGSSVSGNVIDGIDDGNDGTGNADYLGGDDAAVTFVSGSNGSGGAGASVGGTYGSVTIAADGSYTYTSFTQSVPTGDTDEFTYTVTDADGDTSTATLTIEFTDANEPTASVSSQMVDEAGLDAQDVAGNSGGTPVTIDFDGLSNGQVIDTQHSGVTFSSEAGYEWQTTQTVGSSSAPNSALVGLTGGSVVDGDGRSGTIEFDSPVNNVSINVVADNSNNVVATIDVYENGVLAGSVNAVGDNNGATPIPIDLSGFSNVTKIVFNDVADGDYVGIDDLSYTAAGGGTPDDIGSDPSATTESVTDTLNADFGDDGAGSISAVDHTSFATVDNGTTLDITGDYWTLSVTKATGEYTFALTDNTPEHDAADTTGAGDQVQVGFTYTVMDSDGSTSSSTLTIDVNDDGPSAADDTDAVQEGEGNNVSGNVIDGVSEAGTGAADTVGADGAVVTAVAHQAVQGDSGGAGDTVYGTYGFVTIAADGSYTYEVTAASIPPGATDVFEYTLTDGDTVNPDTAPAFLTISFIDANSPVASQSSNWVDEAALPDGTNDTATTESVTANLNIAWGLDGPGGVTAVSMGGETTVDNGTTFDITGDYWTLSVTKATGAYTFSLTDNTTDHTDPNATGASDEVPLTFSYSVEDSDGSTSSNTLTIDVRDDGPVAVDGADLNVTEGEGSQSGTNLLTNDEPGADGYDGAVTAIDYTNTSGAPASANISSGGSAVVSTQTGSLTVNSDGSWSFDPNSSVDHSGGAVSESFDYTITDMDGDSSTATQDVNIADTAPLAVQDTDLNVTEGEGSQSGKGLLINDSTGQDTPIAVTSIDYTDSNGSAASANISAGGSAVVSTQTGSLTVNSDGSWSFDPNDSVDHSGGAVSESFDYTIMDSDGDSSTATQDVNIADTAPLAAQDTDLDVTEGDGDTSGTNLLSNDTTGQDTPIAVTSIDYTDSNGSAASANISAGGSAVVSTQTGSLTVNSDGSWSFDADASVDHSGGAVSESFDYTIMDSDGDSSTATQDVNIADTAPLAAQDTDLDVTEGDGDTSGTNLLSNDTTGQDTPIAVTSIDYTDSNGSAASADISAGGSAVVSTQTGSLTVNSDGSWSFDANASVDHSGGAVSESFDYTITDSDGDSSTATQDVNIADTAPLAVQDTDLNVTEGEGSQSGKGLLINDTTGQDTPIAVTSIDYTDSSGSAASANISAGGSAVVSTQTGSLTVNSDGSWSFDPNDSVDHSSGAVSESFDYTITDTDGDSSTATQDINIADDVPVAVSDGQLASVDDEASGVNIGTVSSLTGNDTYGADGAAATDAIVIGSGSLGGSVTIDGSNLLYTSATNVAPGGSTSETFTYTIEDADGDTSSATFSVQLTDSGPSIGTPIDSSVDEEGLAGGNIGDSYVSGDLAGEATSVSGVDLDITYGADGAGTVTFDNSQPGLAGLSSGGAAISLTTLANGTLVGYTGNTAPTTTGDASVAFFASLSSAGSGSYDFTLVKPLDHDTANTEDDEVLTFAFTATDSEGDPASDTFTVTVDDDAPDTGTPEHLVLANALGHAGTADLNFGIGADGAASPTGYALTMAMDIDGNQKTLVEGDIVYGSRDGGATVQAMTSGEVALVWHDNADGTWTAMVPEDGAVFTVSVNSDGTYTVTLQDPTPLDGGYKLTELDFSGGVSGGNSDQLVFFDSTADDDNTEGTTNGVPDGIPDGATLMGYALAQGSDGGIGTVNSSTKGMGVSGGNTINVNDDGFGADVSEVLTVHFGEPIDPADLDVNANGEDPDADFVPRALSLSIVTLNVLDAGDYAIVGVHVDDGTDRTVYFKVAGYGGGASAASDVILTIEQGTDGAGSLSGDGTTVATAFVVDMDSGPTGTATVDGAFDHLHFSADVGTDSSYRLVSAQSVEETSGYDIDTTFTAVATDADGDTIDDTFDVTIDSGKDLVGTDGVDILVGNGPAQTIQGMGGDDTLLADIGNDILDGGTGADELHGGTGADTFRWSEADLGSVADDTVDHVDTIKDFSASEGDTLDVSTLLTDMGATDITVTSFFQAVDDGAGNVNLQVDPTGTGSGWQTFAVVENSDLVDVNPQIENGF